MLRHVPSAVLRRITPVLVFALAFPVVSAAIPAAAAGTQSMTRHAPATPFRFRRTMPAQIEAGHPLIRPVADALRRLSDDPLEQLSFVHQVSRLLVEYDSDRRVYGRDDWHATLDEMIERQHESGWRYLRDDCDGRAVFAAHLLADLGIPWRLEASSLKRHAWVSAEVGGVRYDVLDLAPDDPELQDALYRFVGRWVLRKSHLPPRSDLRRAWRERADGNPGAGLTLGLLEIDADGRGLRPRYVVNRLTRPDPAQRVAAAPGGQGRAGLTRRGADSDPRAAGQ